MIISTTEGYHPFISLANFRIRSRSRSKRWTFLKRKLSSFLFFFFFSIHFAFYQKFFLRIHWNSLEMDAMRINWTKFISSVNMAIEFSKINSKKFIYFIYHDILFLISFRSFHCSSEDHFIITFIRIFSPLNFFHFDLFVALDPSLSNSFSNDIQNFQGPPNGSIHLTVPRAPPPPRAKSPPENQPLLQNATVSSRVSQATMSEMRVWCLDPPPKPVVPDVLTASTLL